ncbi:MAG: DUF4391 domain-containing protein [Mangrovibacterium sp.]
MLHLPKHTEFNQSIPKNSFHSFITSKQKKFLTDEVEKIRWTHKLSPETIQLAAKSGQEIQVIWIEFRSIAHADAIIQIVERFIPYQLIVVQRFGQQQRICTSCKHPHPSKEQESVIDWTFSSNWFDDELMPYELKLQNSLDDVFDDLCFQISGRFDLPIKELVAAEKEAKSLQNQIVRLESKIRQTTQFNEKVKLNQELQQLQPSLRGF